jgi:hypothetical protein
MIEKDTKDTASIEALISTGDIGKMSPEQRIGYYKTLCEATGLNPVGQPFEYMTLQGKTVLYAKRQAAEQLRKLHSISIKIISRTTENDTHSVVARATTPDGRCDESVGAVSIANLKGDALANAFMKAETKAKRRVTLSLCGLGMLDESEIETIPNARRVDFDVATPPALPAADESLAMAEIAKCETVEALQNLAPRLSALAPKAAPYRAAVVAAYRAAVDRLQNGSAQ